MYDFRDSLFCQCKIAFHLGDIYKKNKKEISSPKQALIGHLPRDRHWALVFCACRDHTPEQLPI